MASPRIAVLFIGTSVYLKFFERFQESVMERFAPEASRHLFVFSDNHLARVGEHVTFTKVPFANQRDVKLRKFHYIAQVAGELSTFDYVFYFDADSMVMEPIGLELIESWFVDGKAFVGVLHPWRRLRSTDKHFEKNPASAACVALEEFDLMEYHQSCFWGAVGRQIEPMVEAVREMIERDLKIGHVNEHLICDEIYVNRYFLSHREQLRSLETDFANPGEAYERLTAKEGKAGYRFPQRQVIVHDNAGQTKSWSRAEESSAFFTHGVFAQFYKSDLAAYMALKSYRASNPANPIHLVSDGGDDLAALASKFDCNNIHEAKNIGTSPRQHQGTDQFLWLGRIDAACRTTLTGADWVVLLEPDVECFHAPKHTPQYALAGPSPGPAWSPPLRERFQRRFGKLTRHGGLGCHYTGCGGSIFNREIFLRCFAHTAPADFDEACRLDERIRVAQDAALTFVFQHHGYDTGRWEDFTGWRDENRRAYAFVHGDKQHYGKPIPN